jgi:transcriptional regulator with XRE-family HTH domain
MTDVPQTGTPTLTERVAGAVRAEMARAQMTQRELAAAIGVQQPNVSLRLQGKHPFSTAELDKIAAFLNVPVERFVTDAPVAGAA